MSTSVEYINTLLNEQSAPFECTFSESKGRMLTMTAPAERRKVLYTGSLLHKVNENVKSPLYKEIFRLFHFGEELTLDYEAMWYWCGLNSLAFPISEYLTCVSGDQSNQLKMLHHVGKSEPSETMRRIYKVILPFLHRELTDSDLLEIETMTIIWTLNCFEHGENPLCFAIFFLPSFMSHACCPSAMWTTCDVDQFVIRAQRPMDVGEELTVSYLTEEFGLCPIYMRREYLESTKFFLCDCKRCTAESDDTRGFQITTINSPQCNHIVQYPKWSECVLCGSSSNFFTPAQITSLLSLESTLVSLVLQYNGFEAANDGVFPTKTDPSLFKSIEAAEKLEQLILQIGPAHWTAMRGWLQLTEYYKSHGKYARAIHFLKLRINSRRMFFTNLAAPQVSPSLAWALEDLADLFFLTNEVQLATEALAESVEILTGLFGPQHEYTVPLSDKLARLLI